VPKSPDNKSALKAFGKRLRFLRSVENLTQNDLAELAGISFEHVNKLERGASGPSFAVVCALAQALGTQPANLFLFTASDDSWSPDKDAVPASLLDDIPGVDSLQWTRFISHCGYWYADLASGKVQWSAGLYKLLGYKPGEVAPDSATFLERHLPEEERNRSSQRWKDLLQGRPLPDNELHFQRKDGEHRLGWTHSDVEYNDAGSPIVARGVMLDLTELRRLEGFLLQNQVKLEAMVRMRTAHRDEVIKELKEKTEEAQDKARTLEEVLQRYEETYQRYKRLYHDAPVGFATLDSMGIVQEGNAVVCDLLGCDHEALQGADMATLLDIQPQQLDAHLERVFHLDQSVTFETRTPPESICGVRHVMLQLAPSHMEEGRKVCLVAISDISERKWAEQALAELNEHYRVMAEESGDAICIIAMGPDQKPYFLYTNSEFNRCFGLVRNGQDYTFHDFLQKIHPDQRDMVCKRCLQRLDGEKPPKRYAFQLAGEPETWLEIYAGSIVVGGTPAVLGGFRDVTRNKLTERRLQQSEAQLRAIYDAIPMLICIWRRQGDDFFLADLNKSTLDFAPYIQKHMGAAASEFYKANPRVLELLRACSEQRQTLRETLNYTMHDTGRQEHLRMSFVPLSSDSVLLLAENVTRRQKELALQDLERRRLATLHTLSSMQQRPLHEIMDYALEQAVALTESEYGYIYLMDAKQRRLQLFAWSEAARRDCTVQNPTTSFRVEDTGLWGDAVRRREPVITNDYPGAAAIRELPKGHVPLVRHCNTPIIREGRIRVVLGVANKQVDYSDTDIQVMNLLMERVLDLWDEKITRGRLTAAKRMAEQANRNKSRHLADVSHEIRTPLNGLLGMLHLLQSSSLEPKQLQHLEHAREAGADLLRLVNDVLDFSGIESGKVQLHPEPCDLRGLVRKSLHLHEPKARAKGLELGMEVDDAVPARVLLDPVRLGQVVDNLVDNAVKFTPHGRVDVSLSMRGHASPDRLEIRVSDTGQGLHGDMRENLFKPFHKGRGTGDRIPGTGLGLSIVKSLVEIMGGSVAFEDTPGGGATFICLLPAEHASGPYDSREREYDIAEPEPAEVCEEPEAPGSLRILVVDDDFLSRRVLEEVLRRHGHEVHAAANGQEALETASSADFDLVFMDVQMPVMDGLEALKRIRAGACPGLDPDVPVVALTACALKGDRENLLHKGMDGYLPKPLEVDEVLETVRRMARSR